MSTRHLIPLLALLAGLSFAAGAQDDRLPALPPFEAPALGGGTITDLDLAGDVVLMFTVPGCAACGTAMDLLKAAAETHPDISFRLAVPEDNEAAHTMLTDYDIDWPVLVDSGFVLASIYGVRTVPFALFIRDGEAVTVLHTGFTADDLQAALDELAAYASEAPIDEAFAPLVSFYRAEEPLLLLFAGAECPYCHSMLPDVYTIAEWFHVTIVITEELTDPAPFETDAAHVTMVLDPTWRLADLFGVQTVPHLFFIGRDGTVLWDHQGVVLSLPIVARQVALREVY